MTDTKPKRIRLSPEARQEHLLDCSAEIIATDGIAGFTMEGLAKRANVSAPLVYNYFPNRIELLQTLLKRRDIKCTNAGSGKSGFHNKYVHNNKNQKISDSPKAITFSMDGASNNQIKRRSIPSAIPQLGGIPSPKESRN